MQWRQTHWNTVAVCFLDAIITAYGKNLRRLIQRSGRNAPPNLPPPVEREFWIEQLKIPLQREGVSSLGLLLNDPTMALAKEDLALRWAALLAGIELYVLRVLEGSIATYIARSTPPEVGVSFKLLGQGWELLCLYEDENGTFTCLTSL